MPLYKGYKTPTPGKPRLANSKRQTTKPRRPIFSHSMKRALSNGSIAGTPFAMRTCRTKPLDLDRIEPSAGEHGAALQGTQVVTVEEGISLTSERPYGPGSQRFVRRVAALDDEGAFTDAVSTLDRLIHEARALVH